MATYDITAPDGTKWQVNAPDTASESDVLNYAKSQWQSQRREPTERDTLLNNTLMRTARGMKAPIDSMASLLARGAEVAPIPFAPANSPYRLSDAAKAVTDVASAVLPEGLQRAFFADPSAKAVDADIAQAEQEYKQARKATGNENKTDWAGVVGTILSPGNVIPGRAALSLAPATASVGKLALSGAGAGGIAGFLTSPVTENQDSYWTQKAQQTGVGAAAGAVLTPLVSKAVEYVAPRVAALFSSKQPSEAAVNQAIDRVLGDLETGLRDVPNEVREQIRAQVKAALQANTADPAAALRQADFQGLGMRGLLGQITRDPQQFATERNIRGTPSGNEITAVLMEQNRRLRELVGGYGNQAKSPYQAGEELIGALKQTDDKMSAGVRQAYQAARASSGKDLELPLQGLAQDYAQVLRDFGDKIPSGVRNNLDDLGLLTGRQNRLYTVEEAEKLLQVINANRSADPATNNALSRLRDAVKRSVMDATGDGGAFESARKLAAERFSVLDKTPALQAAISDAAPDKFVGQFVINGKVRDVRSMADLLKKESPDAFEQARQQLGSYLQRAAFGDDVAGDKVFAAQNFAKKLREIGNEKLLTFYTPQEVQALHQIARVAQYINSPPAASAVNYSNNSAWALSLLEKMPGVGGLASMMRGMLGSARQGLQARKALMADLPPPPPPAPPQLERYFAYPPVAAGLLSGAVVAP